MARLNIEDCWWTDPRRSALQKLQLDAEGIATRAWRLAQDFWKHGRSLVPKALFNSLDGAPSLIQVGLAEVQGEFVYVRGSSAYLDWVAEQREAAKRGGQKSAKRPRDAKGKLTKSSKLSPSEVQGESKVAQVSVSVSGSFSDSGSLFSKGEKNENSGSGSAPKEGRALSSSGVFIGEFVSAYQTRYGKKARPDLRGKIQGLIKKFVEETSTERACQLIRTYCEMDDQWFLTKGHDFVTFVENLSKIGLKLDTGSSAAGPLNYAQKREASNLSALGAYKASLRGHDESA